MTKYNDERDNDLTAFTIAPVKERSEQAKINAEIRRKDNEELTRLCPFKTMPDGTRVWKSSEEMLKDSQGK